MSKSKFISSLFFLLAFSPQVIVGQSHPSLILTTEGVREIKGQLNRIPMLRLTLENTVVEVGKAMERGIDVPVPKDLAGGYTHEQHKSNFFILQKAGLLFQLTGEEKYAKYVRDVLMEYAKLFPGLDRHPAKRSYARGKFFWQCLNDSNWLVYVSQAYDCIYDWIKEPERKYLNEELFRPLADFLSVETPQFFNRIHNHSTWGNAAVGMIGLVMDDEELVQRALYGSDINVAADIIKDNDGGLIELPGQKEAGFLAQMDHSFSPDGYYTEGPYYQRYAMYPFLVFAQALANKRPGLKIFRYRDGVLIKGVYALLHQTNSAGEFFPINDAQKGMSYLSRELVTAVNIAYHFGDQDPALLSIVEKQGQVPLNDTGLSTALGLLNGPVKPFGRKSVELRDGANGDEGAVGILRSGSPETEVSLVMKYTKHGMGHGHFDKLSFLYYHNENEVFQDYGAARWVNVEQKDGGGYLKENRTWAKQTIAHNTVVVNRKSQFDANVQEADKYFSTPCFFNTADPDTQLMGAKESNAYPGVTLHRTMVLIRDGSFNNPLVLDLFRVESTVSNNYDLPFYFMGHVMATNFDYQPEPSLSPMGAGHGYQHLWKEAGGVPYGKDIKLNWFNRGSFYSLTTTAEPGDSLLFGRTGASDPNFNLRRDPVFIVRRSNTSNTLFASIIETHGSYSPVDEIAVDAYSSISSLEVLENNGEYTAVEFASTDGVKWTYVMSNQNADRSKKHTLNLGNKTLKWEGVYDLIREKI